MDAVQLAAVELDKSPTYLSGCMPGIVEHSVHPQIPASTAPKIILNLSYTNVFKKDNLQLLLNIHKCHIMILRKYSHTGNYM